MGLVQGNVWGVSMDQKFLKDTPQFYSFSSVVHAEFCWNCRFFPQPCSPRRAQIQRRSDCHPPTLHGQIGHLISFEPHPLGKAYNPGACNARSASRRCRFTEGFARAPRGIFLKCSSLWASEFLRECLPKLAVEVTARPEFSACMQRSLAQPGSGADP